MAHNSMQKGAVVTIGIFDGVHKGHQAIIARLISEARRFALRSVVLTFEPHPLRVLAVSSAPHLLASLSHRMRILKELGVDEVKVVRFTEAFARLSAEEFVRKFLVERLNAKRLVVGSDFVFGHKRRGGIGLLKRFTRRFGIKLIIVAPLEVRGRAISSTRIRDLIEGGSLEYASRLLGRTVSIQGTVIRGFTRGRALGFPTANINPHHECLPPSGVYAVRAQFLRAEAQSAGFKKRSYKGILNIGRRPTFGHTDSSVEVHLFDFRRDIYGRDLEIFFIKRIRDEKKFSTKDGLIRQIKLDECAARKIFNERVTYGARKGDISHCAN